MVLCLIELMLCIVNYMFYVCFGCPSDSFIIRSLLPLMSTHLMSAIRSGLDGAGLLGERVLPLIQALTAFTALMQYANTYAFIWDTLLNR